LFQQVPKSSLIGSLNIKQDFLKKIYVRTWDTNPEYIKLQTSVQKVKVVNDAVNDRPLLDERCVALCQPLRADKVLSNQEVQKQFLLQVIESTNKFIEILINL